MAIARTIFREEHQQFRDALDRFLTVEVAPNCARYERQGYIARDIWRKGGEAGYLCSSTPEEYGSAGADKLYSVVVFEQPARHGLQKLLGWALHSGIVAPYLLHYGSERVKRAYLPRMARGEMIGAIAMTEPGAGSDLLAVRATATREGDGYRISGTKTFVTNGSLCDLIVVAAKTDATEGAKGISLFVTDAATASMAKYWCTDLQCKVLDACLQLHGGYGYIWDYPIARAWADARVARIYGGANETMKLLIARQLP